MKNIMDKHTIINLKRKGHSNRAVERITGINRKTIARYWNGFTEQSELLNNLTKNVSKVQETLVATTKYDASKREARKYNNEMDKRLDQM